MSKIVAAAIVALLVMYAVGVTDECVLLAIMLLLYTTISYNTVLKNQEHVSAQRHLLAAGLHLRPIG